MTGRLLLGRFRHKGGPLFRGEALLEGDFLLGLAALDTSKTKDTSQTFQSSSEGSVRLELPLLGLSQDVLLRFYAEGGFVTVQSLPNYWTQRYYGLRLGMDAADVSGRQSYVDIALGYSENLRPRHARLRVVVQLVIPRTQLAVQFKVNYSQGGHSDPTKTDSPVILSGFTSVDFQSLYNLIAGKGSP
jgi:hypothetical protein